MLVVVLDIHYRDTASRGGAMNLVVRADLSLQHTHPCQHTQQFGEAVRASKQVICGMFSKSSAISDADLPSKAPTSKAPC